MDYVQVALDTLNARPEFVILAGVAISAFVIIQGLSGMLAADAPAARRMHAGISQPAHGADFDLLQGDDSAPHGLLKAFVPSSRKERSKLGRQLRRAGIQSKYAMRSFYSFRMIMGICLPASFLFAMSLPVETQAQLNIAALLKNLTWFQVFQIVTALMVAGFYAPAVWLRGRIKNRRQAIE
tara:strand:+ start:21 stop:566 length:546 start_codon:yes stop_codon:yes gene_type:complete